MSYRLTPGVMLYPELRVQLSGSEANSLAGINGLPDAEDPEKDDRLQNFTLQAPLIIQLESLQAWIGLNPQYTKSFAEKNYFLFLRTDFGKMVGDKTSLAITISKFVAGQPRLNVIVQGKFQFFIGR
ncbi:MAG: hypothetical protein HC859_05255 [Bacteroidia bacterium]|nr:hypothetical protein [Bacteroidia bacterium]